LILSKISFCGGRIFRHDALYVFDPSVVARVPRGVESTAPGLIESALAATSTVLLTKGIRRAYRERSDA